MYININIYIYIIYIYTDIYLYGKILYIYTYIDEINLCRCFVNNILCKCIKISKSNSG